MLPVVEGKVGYILGVVGGSLVTAVMVNLLKKVNTDKEIKAEEDFDLEFEEL
ncbi:putative PTS system fructose-like transporter subunit EIIC [compost metagenome]